MNEIKFYQVGGCVRDEILGIKSKDIDYAVEAPSYAEMKAAIEGRGGQIFLETPQYFTIRAKVPQLGAADFVLCRKDGEYVDGRRPETVEVGTLYDDLARRDFTMNAIAKGEDGSYIDPYEGQLHIKQRCIVAVGNPYERFSEDYLRMLRAIRFAVTKKFGISKAVRCAIFDLHNHVAEVSVERIREELGKAFEADTLRTLNYLREFDLDGLLFSGNLGLRLKPTLEK
jgi:tRNA nucleotidyltransferase (CCA-adding enzyme)